MPNVAALLLLLGAAAGAQSGPVVDVAGGMAVAGFWTLARVAGRDGDALPELPAVIQRLLCDWAASRAQLTIAPGNASVMIVDGRGAVTVFSTSGAPDRLEMAGVSVLVTTRWERTALRQRIEIEGRFPFALAWSLHVEGGQLVATLSLDNPIGPLRTLERRIYTSDAVP
jgi:hypothetical protein